MRELDSILDSHLMPDEIARMKPAGKLKRFLNLLLDYLGFIVFLTLYFIFSALIGADDFFYQPQSPDVGWQRLQGILAMFAYYVISEYYLGGKTLGKFITGTKVVTKNGNAPDIKSITLRALARFIPFEPLSYLGFGTRGWHDQLSNTMVIEDR